MYLCTCKCSYISMTHTTEMGSNPKHMFFTAIGLFCRKKLFVLNKDVSEAMHKKKALLDLLYHQV